VAGTATAAQRDRFKPANHVNPHRAARMQLQDYPIIAAFAEGACSIALQLHAAAQ
jgi:hypothetical protein